ncbi:hypothetical protein M2232_002300 [Bradyrhizobium japonicum]|uniref:hypothetical protein n=1 Tax=Bradyrhizobium japonicum TaxID=375 RepID=UPI00222807A4|nr:hypothetical protein [Bradyrhizobium japonicum]MCW2218768.1 hypothetical protein [Bradyrhizobium japonicum]MCW2343382.1 hypothetical protein [Bradyrhizobium japonicum]
MAINPVRYDMPGSFIGEIDWSPLARIGETLRKNREEEEAARLIAQLYGSGQNSPQQNGPQVTQAPPVGSPPVAAAAAGPAVAERIPLPRPRPQEATGLPGPTVPPGVTAPPWFDQAAAQTFGQYPIRSGTAPVPTTQPPPWPGAEAPVAQAPVEQAPPLQQASPVAQAAPGAQAADPMARYAQATSAIESGSPQGNYRLVGPQTKTGDRAFGRYQVMGANVPEWTERYYGQRLTPREFLINPQAQDAVYKGEFGRLVDKYGPTGAAKAWFAGERGMNNPNARDILGTSVSSYADRFNRNLGLPPEITSGASRGAPQSNALAFNEVRNSAVGALVSDQPQAPAISPEQLAGLARNPLTRPLAIGLVQKQLDPGTYDFKVVGDNLVRTNSRTGRSEIMMRDVKNDYEVKTVKDDSGNERLVRVKKQGAEGPIDIGGAGADTGGKLPANYRWLDPNDHAKGVEPIPGATPEKIGDEIVARIGLAKSFMGTLPDLRARVARGDVGIENWQNHAKAIANVGVPGETKRMLDAGAESLIRLLTGAGMSQTEAEQNAQQYRITPRDTTFTINSKINGLERHLSTMGELLGKGRGGGNLLTAPLAAPAAAPAVAAAAPAQGPKRITTDAEYDALPPNTLFVGPDGKPRRKP